MRVVKGGQTVFFFFSNNFLTSLKGFCGLTLFVGIPCWLTVNKLKIIQIFLLGTECFHKLTIVLGWVSPGQTLRLGLM